MAKYCLVAQTNRCRWCALETLSTTWRGKRCCTSQVVICKFVVLPFAFTAPSIHPKWSDGVTNTESFFLFTRKKPSDVWFVASVCWANQSRVTEWLMKGWLPEIKMYGENGWMDAMCKLLLSIRCSVLWKLWEQQGSPVFSAAVVKVPLLQAHVDQTSDRMWRKKILLTLAFDIYSVFCEILQRSNRGISLQPCIWHR